jgi:hypothetical protein
MSLAAPVAVAIFNRPECTRKLVSALRPARPATIFLIADGPRSRHEEDACKQTRALFDDLDWACTVHRDFSDSNLGTRKRIVTGLDRVFAENEAAIILEDDCIPSASFFPFCQALLARYRDDERIMEVGGCNHQLGARRTACSYYFSRRIHTWGWATWRRAWRHFDEHMAGWPDFKRRGALRPFMSGPLEEAYWTRMLDDVYAGRKTETWDYQWLFCLWARGGFSIVPEVNLVSNIGHGQGATHTTDPAHVLANLPTGDIGEIVHPDAVEANDEADLYEFRKAHGGEHWSSLPARIRRKARDLQRLIRGG